MHLFLAVQKLTGCSVDKNAFTFEKYSFAMEGTSRLDLLPKGVFAANSSRIPRHAEPTIDKRHAVSLSPHCPCPHPALSVSHSPPWRCPLALHVCLRPLTVYSSHTCLAESRSETHAGPKIHSSGLPFEKVGSLAGALPTQDHTHTHTHTHT